MERAHITQRIKAIREQAGLTMSDAASATGYRTVSGYQHYEDASKFNQEYLPAKVAAKFIKAFAGKGRPSVTVEQILALTQPLGGDGADEKRLARAWWSLQPEDRHVVAMLAESMAHRKTA